MDWFLYDNLRHERVKLIIVNCPKIMPETESSKITKDLNKIKVVKT